MNPSTVIAIILTASIVGLVYLLAFLDKTDTDTFKILVGALMSVGFTNVIGFYFGSSVASKAKDETITSLVTGTGPGAVVAAAKEAAPAAAKEAAPPAANVAAPPAAEIAVEHALAERDINPERRLP